MFEKTSQKSAKLTKLVGPQCLQHVDGKLLHCVNEKIFFNALMDEFQ